jgi:hypothetical protein
MTVEAGWLAGWSGLVYSKAMAQLAHIVFARTRSPLAHYYPPRCKKPVPAGQSRQISLSSCRSFMQLDFGFLVALFFHAHAQVSALFPSTGDCPCKAVSLPDLPLIHHQRGGLSGQYPDSALATGPCLIQLTCHDHRMVSYYKRPQAYFSHRVCRVYEIGH